MAVRIALCAVSAVAVFLVMFAPAAAQVEVASRDMPFELTPYGGYIFGGGIIATDGELRLSDAGLYGVIVGIPMIRFPGAELELSYTRQTTDVTLRGQSFAGDQPLFDLAVEFWHAGVLQEFRYDGSLRPFALISLGATGLKPEGRGLSDEWLFSFAVAGGAKWMLNDHLGVRLQGRGTWSFVTAQTSFLCGGGGCLISVTGNTVFQVDFSGGLVLAY